MDAQHSCAAEVHQGVVFISGGGDSLQTAYLIDVNNGSVTMLPQMPNERRSHACGTVPSVALGGMDIVVAGGTYYETVSLFNTAQQTWRPGPALPYKIDSVN